MTFCNYHKLYPIFINVVPIWKAIGQYLGSSNFSVLLSTSKIMHSKLKIIHIFHSFFNSFFMRSVSHFVQFHALFLLTTFCYFAFYYIVLMYKSMSSNIFSYVFQFTENILSLSMKWLHLHSVAIFCSEFCSIWYMSIF